MRSGERNTATLCDRHGAGGILRRFHRETRELRRLEGALFLFPIKRCGIKIAGFRPPKNRRVINSTSLFQSFKDWNNFADFIPIFRRLE